MFEQYPIFWSIIRQAFLNIVDAIEREMGVNPTTAQIRDIYKKHIKNHPS